MKESKPNYIEFYDPRLVEIYDTINPVSSYEKFYLDLAKKLDAKSILDIGCGSGLLTTKLAEQGHQMIGLEPSGPLLSLARKRSENGNIQWIEGDVSKLQNLQVDLAIMTGHVAQFFLENEDWKNALVRIHDSLKTGGYLAFESRNPNVPQFADWPTEESHQKLSDPKAGPIEWWHEPINKLGNRVKYGIHYLFTNSGQELVSLNELIFRSKEEISKSLEDSGFEIENTYGDWNSDQLTDESPEMIFIVKKK